MATRAAMLRDTAWLLVSHRIGYTLAKVPSAHNAADPVSRTPVATMCTLDMCHAAVVSGRFAELEGHVHAALGMPVITEYNASIANMTAT